MTNVIVLQGNPYLRLWTEAARRAGAEPALLSPRSVLSREKPAWVHLQWPERVLDPQDAPTAARRMGRLLGLVALARLRGARVLYTAHNVRSHSRRHPRLERILWRAVGRLATDLHLLDAAGGEEVLAEHPRLRRARLHVIPHGNYAPVVAGAPERAEARAALGVAEGERVLASFGFLRAYKGVEEMLDAFRATGGGTLRLIVAGRTTDDELAGRLRRAGAGDARVTLLNEFLDDDDLARLIRAADGVVLPYRRVLNSGSAMLTLSLRRPVLLPRTPTFAALAERTGPGWVTLYDEPLEAADLEAFAHPAPSGAPELGWCDWERVSDLQRTMWSAS